MEGFTFTSFFTQMAPHTTCTLLGGGALLKLFADVPIGVQSEVQDTMLGCE